MYTLCVCVVSECVCVSDTQLCRLHNWRVVYSTIHPYTQYTHAHHDGWGGGEGGGGGHGENLAQLGPMLMTLISVYFSCLSNW